MPSARLCLRSESESQINNLVIVMFNFHCKPCLNTPQKIVQNYNEVQKVDLFVNQSNADQMFIDLTLGIGGICDF